MRAHAHVEDHIGRLKDSGLLRFPFTDFAANAAWASCRVLGSGPGPLVPAALCHRAPGPGAAQTAALATVAHNPPASFVKPEATSSASSTDGPPPPTSSPPTDTSPPSPDRRPAPILNAGRGTATPSRPPNQPPGTTRASTHPDQPANATPEPKPSIDTDQPDVP